MSRLMLEFKRPNTLSPLQSAPFFDSLNLCLCLCLSEQLHWRFFLRCAAAAAALCLNKSLFKFIYCRASKLCAQWGSCEGGVGVASIMLFVVVAAGS